MLREEKVLDASLNIIVHKIQICIAMKNRHTSTCRNNVMYYVWQNWIIIATNGYF